MTSARWFGVGKCLSWAAMLLVALSSVACGSDSNGSVPGTGGAPESPEGPPATDMGGEPNVGEGGAGNPVTPGELVCKNDEDCSTREKPVCDQVLGCVACQYDWDCPAGHRCDDNECFEKQACATDGDCTRDPARPVCDAVQQLCVGCREDAECGEGKRCEASDCVAFEACTNSRDCAGGKVCSRAVGACVGCVVDGDCGAGSACVNDACVPTCGSDKDCLGVGMLCDQQVKRCVECLSHDDCPTQYFCGASGRCSLDTCEQGQTRCDGTQVLGTCSKDGDAFVGSTCAGDTRCREQDEVSAACEPLVCTPGAITCAAERDAVERCSADGFELELSERCGEGEICRSGSCVEVVCAPGTFVCEGATLSECNSDGSELIFRQSCTGEDYSGCDADAGQCRPRTCFATQPVCEGNVATFCKQDGSGGEPGGTDCDLSGEACFNGTCQAKLCTGAYSCQGSTLKRCVSNGTALSPQAECNFATLCDATAGKCIQPTCTPGAFVCDGTVATRCKADGSGYQPGGEDCSASNQVCDGGGCLPKGCTPGATFCQGGSPQKCGASGATYEPTDTCQTFEYCSETSTVCQADLCKAGAAVCNGNLATTCQSDGSGPLAGGVDCAATSKVCENGACVAVSCTPGVLSCQGEAVYQCNAKGTGTTLYDSCSLAEFCDTSGETTACSPDLCSSGAVGCNGEVISVCATNGGAWVSPGTDCKATSQVCTLGGTCAAEEVATQGTTTYSLSATNAAALSAFRTTTARKLTKLEVHASFGGLQKVTWVVYEKRVGADAYDLVYQKVTAQTMPVAGLLASPPLDFLLAKGKSYAVGAHIAGVARFGYMSSASASYLAKASFVVAAFAPSRSSGAAQPNSSITPSSEYSDKLFVRFTTAVAP